MEIKPPKNKEMTQAFSIKDKNVQLLECIRSFPGFSLIRHDEISWITLVTAIDIQDE